jgi:hypothetical protein
LATAFAAALAAASAAATAKAASSTSSKIPSLRPGPFTTCHARSDQNTSTLFVGKESTEEVQQYIARSCRANGKLFATSGKHHLVVCFPNQGIRFYHDGTSSCAVEGLLKLTDSPLRKVYFEGDSPFVKDILVNKLIIRELPLQI